MKLLHFVLIIDHVKWLFFVKRRGKGGAKGRLSRYVEIFWKKKGFLLLQKINVGLHTLGDVGDKPPYTQGRGGRSGTIIRTRGGERSEPSVCPRTPPIPVCFCMNKYLNGEFQSNGVVGTFEKAFKVCGAFTGRCSRRYFVIFCRQTETHKPLSSFILNECNNY